MSFLRNACSIILFAVLVPNTVTINAQTVSKGVKSQNNIQKETKMTVPCVIKIVELLPSKVISFHVTNSMHPEDEVYKIASDFAKPKGLWNDPLHYQVFGFDNPVRKSSTDTHGREVWITVPDNFQKADSLIIKQFNGGLYAMVRIKNLEYMDEGWTNLINWVKNSDRYELGQHQHLEGHIDDNSDEEMQLELYLPIKLKK
jgi:DNA gyrase inhibitor GyrI